MVTEVVDLLALLCLLSSPSTSSLSSPTAVTMSWNCCFMRARSLSMKPTFSQLFILFLPLLFSLFSGQTFLLQHHPLLLLNLPHKGFIQLLLHLKASFHVSDCLCTEFSKGTIGRTVLWLAIHHMT